MKVNQKKEKICLGTFPFANVFGEIKVEDVQEILEKYINDFGGLMQVSVVYNAGKVEELLGELLKKYDREKFKIMSCCGWKEDNGNYSLSGKREDVISACENSLGRLKLDYVDMMMSHAPDTTTSFRETVDAMRELKDQGKIRGIAVSNVSLEQLKEYNYAGDVDLIQNRFSLLNQSLSEEFVSYCNDNNIIISTYQSIERGLLTDYVKGDFVLAKEDLRNKKEEFRKEKKEYLMNWVREYLAPIADKLNVSLTTMVLCWSFQRANVDCCFCGISKMKHFKDYQKIENIKLDKSVLDNIDSAYNILLDNIEKEYGTTIREFMGLV